MRILISRDLVAYSSISKDVDSMHQSIDVNGPAILSDSSLALWCLILRKRSTVVQSANFHLGERLFQWFTSKWRPAHEGLEKSNVISFLSVCCGIDFPSINPYPQRICGPIGQACIRMARYRRLHNMLLNEEDDAEDVETNSNAGLQHQIVDFLEHQVKQGVSGVVMQNFVGFILTSCVMCSRALENKLREIEDCSQKQIDGVLFAICSFLPRASEILNLDDAYRDNLRGTTGRLFAYISDTLEEKEKVANSFNQSDSRDAMDIDDGFGFPDNERDEEKKGGGLLREELEALYSEETFRASTSALLALCTLSLKNSEPADICAQFVEYLIGNSKTRLIMMGAVIKDFMSAANDKLLDEDATSICVHLARELLQGYDIERCETSVAVCIDAVTAVAAKWTSNNQNPDLVETCEEVFGHVIKIGLDKQITSYSIRNSISLLLERILYVNPDYRKGHEQSPLSLFIGLLKDLDIRVIFFVAQRLHALFKIFGESAHLKLTQDIEAALPSIKDWVEGLVIRVHALGLVALASLSNISRVIYRIFETGQIPDAEPYAARVLLTIAKASGLGTQRGLFKLFCSKLIFTWTEYYDLQDLPPLVFGYGSLTEMCKDVPEELIAQLLVKGKDEYAKFVASRNGVTLKELILQSFAKVVAYSLAWSVGHPPPKGKEGDPSISVQIRKRIGDDVYSQLFVKNFPLIISNLYQLMQEDGTSEKLLSRDPNLAEVHHVMQEITAEGYSARTLAKGLEPHFKTRVILNAIHHACTTISVDDLWTPSMVTFVARRLFDTLHPAQGPVHTCSVIRNIRFLICLAGPKVHEGYPLQMLIQGLKSYITDTACTDDTIGILRYLLSKGNEYLSKHPSFQDTQTRSTLSVVQSFRSWLAEHLAKLEFQALSPTQNNTFQSIVQSAVGFRHNGNALKNTKESELLRLLLDDDMTTDKLLDDASRQLAFTLFCSDFARPESFREDIFGADQQSFERSKSLLRICRRSGVNDGFLLWSARVLGRSYASTGQLHIEWTKEMEFYHPIDITSRVSWIDVTPKVGILRRLKALLFSDDKNVAGLAEGTLARIINEEAQLREDTRCHVLEDEYRALQWAETPSIGEPTTSFTVWVKDLAITMCTNMPGVPVIICLHTVLREVEGLAEELFPYITHILLARDMKTPKGLREEISNLFRLCFHACEEKTIAHNTLLIKTILYLRTQQVPEREASKASRDHWLEIDYLVAARAACTCKMFKTALLFTEMYSYKVKHEGIPSELLLEIFKNIDDPDSFYGVSQTFSLETVMNNFEYEGDGWKSLSLRGANLESGMRLGVISEDESLGIINALNTLGMNGYNTYRSAWKLEQWDLPCPASCNTRSAPIYRALQSINNTVDSRPVSLHVDPHFLDVMKQITAGTQTGHTLGSGMRTLAMLTEMEEVFVSKNYKQLGEAWDRLQNRNSWMETGKYADVEEMMAMRQATFSSMAKRHHLRIHAGVDQKQSRYMEAKALVGCCKMARSHKVLQHALSAATQLNKVVEPCREAGLDISGIATLQTANVLWEDGQGVPSIRMLTALEKDRSNSSQSMVVRRAKLLAKLGSRLSEARLEKPDKIMSRYLEKAIEELRNNESGPEAGRVFHEFANFCDQQLQNPSNIEDFERVSKLKEDKQKEVNELVKLNSKAGGKDGALYRELAKAKSWLALDNAEYNRLRDNRDAFMEKSILNYLRCLAACDDYDGDAVRFSALWLGNADEERVNRAASILDKIPSRKLVPLMNQLSSRLLNEKNEFQRLLRDLIIRICHDHPYHGLYQILALTKTNPNDDTAASRHTAAVMIVDHLKQKPMSRVVVSALDSTTQAYDKLAQVKADKKKDNNRMTLSILLQKERERARRFERDIPSYGIPPPTMHIEVRADCDYSRLPRISRYESAVSIASGLSLPKVINCVASDGTTFKQLVKGGTDDMRQDAIMEQVFEQVSVLLRRGRITRQRNLKIRTYKVVPLSSNSGIIEFVPNTIPLGEYLLDAHAKYYPKAWKHLQCRKVIFDAQGKSRDVRTSEYQRVTQNFPPVMHFFFMHEFNGPDDWYTSRLAYTRSTAAISILGHVLGLGDRHIHNILLDTKTGEVIHIDLGVAFEQGRILPVPEVVPFRLTRDIVDGMGITKTEGVFRRCCEFTLEVLRNEAYSITTILDVLRYDPLYSWSISPLRMKRMQDNHLEQSIISARSVDGQVKMKNNEGESEADRALTVVAKKLSKTLSVGAIVNELIQLATDERNLAVLFAGWQAYA
ncbi:hypothetical protein BDD12DRAFT_862201 [Trichophaea hybrida]|nr:hypothetical protein BDD12DRAFT_862201 [Trichophaea hybrida]